MVGPAALRPAKDVMMRAMALVAAAGIAVLSFAMPASAQDKSKAELGAALFSSQKCTLCHAVAGKGNPKGPLDGVAAKLTAQEIRQWIVDPDAMRVKAKATRTPAMKRLKLTTEQVDGLVAYLQTLK
jgi:mono/diheme cytochrome c family protein